MGGKLCLYSNLLFTEKSLGCYHDVTLPGHNPDTFYVRFSLASLLFYNRLELACIGTCNRDIWLEKRRILRYDLRMLREQLKSFVTYYL
jgi:hypothetical protein